MQSTDAAHKSQLAEYARKHREATRSNIVGRGYSFVKDRLAPLAIQQRYLLAPAIAFSLSIIQDESWKLNGWLAVGAFALDRLASYPSCASFTSKTASALRIAHLFKGILNLTSIAKYPLSSGLGAAFDTIAFLNQSAILTKCTHAQPSEKAASSLPPF